MNFLLIFLILFISQNYNCFKYQLPELSFTTNPKYITHKNSFTATCAIVNYANEPIESSVHFFVNFTTNGKTHHKSLAIFMHGGECFLQLNLFLIYFLF